MYKNFLEMDQSLTLRSRDRFVSENGSDNLRLTVGSDKRFTGSLVLSIGNKQGLEDSDSCCIEWSSNASFKNDDLIFKQDSVGEFKVLYKDNILTESIGEEISVGDVSRAQSLFERKTENGENEIGVCLSIGSSEIFLGGAEDPRGCVKNGRHYEVYNTDALGLGGEGRYQNTPVFWSSKGYLLYILNPEPVILDFGQRRTNVLEISTRSKGLSFLIVPFENPQCAFKRFREVFSPASKVPDWSFGLWLSRCFYQDEAELEGILKNANEKNVKIDVVNLDARAWMKAETRTDFVWDESRWAPYQDYISSLRNRGLRVCLWENPYVSSVSLLYKEGCEKGYFAKTKEGDVYPLDWVPDGLEGFPRPPVAGLVDFTNAKAKEWWKDLHRPYLRAGVSAFKTDFGEEVPHDCIFSNGKNGFELRNRYADLYNECVWEVLKEELGEEGILWARSANIKASSHPVKWNGDSQTNFRSLAASIKGGLTQACGGAIFWSHDSGGFYGKKPESELFLRWAQTGLWGSHVRLHGTSAREPWDFGENVLKEFKRSLETRKTLKPYFVSEYLKCTKEQISFVRPMWLEHNDLSLAMVEDQFYAGSSFLVAPFLESAGSRKVTIPEGSWIDLRTGEKVDQGVFIAERTSQLPVFFNKEAMCEMEKSELIKLVNDIVNLNKA